MLFRPLSQLVLKQAPDADVWAGVAVTLVNAICHSTPPPSIPLSHDDTPVTFSSASQQGREQTRLNLEARILEEFRHCTHRDVDGFHAKYFARQSWSKHADLVWEAAKSLHNGRWKGFPAKPTQVEVYKWWFHLQDKLLADT